MKSYLADIMFHLISTAIFYPTMMQSIIFPPVTNLRRHLIFCGALLISFSTAKSHLFAADASDVSWNTLHASVVTPFGATEIHSVFTYVNHSELPITIDTITSQCSCTSGYGIGDVCPPGGSGSIRVFVSTENLRGAQDRPVIVSYHFGADRGHIHVADLHTITNVASTDTCASWDQRFLLWDQNSPSITRTCTFKVHQVRPIHILSCHVAGAGFTATVHEVIPGQIYEVKVTPDSTAVLHWSRILIATDSNIPVLAQCNLSATISIPPKTSASTKKP